MCLVSSWLDTDTMVISNIDKNQKVLTVRIFENPRNNALKLMTARMTRDIVSLPLFNAGHIIQ